MDINEVQAPIGLYLPAHDDIAGDVIGPRVLRVAVDGHFQIRSVFVDYALAGQ
jgi:hypothetical protein